MLLAFLCFRFRQDHTVVTSGQQGALNSTILDLNLTVITSTRTFEMYLHSTILDLNGVLQLSIPCNILIYIPLF